jgi:hypothetical protein
MGIFDSENGLAMLRQRVTPDNARYWGGTILSMLSKRDRDDLERLELKLTTKGLIRLLTVRDHDPIFCRTAAEEQMFKRFATRVEDAWHDLIADLATLRTVGADGAVTKV